VAKAKKRPFKVRDFCAAWTAEGLLRSTGRTRASSNEATRRNRCSISKRERSKSLSYRSRAGKEAVVALHGKGDFFGEGCLTGQPRRLATVSAMTDCVIMRIDKAAMLRALREEPTLSEIFIADILARNARVEEDLVDQLFNSSDKRLARILLLRDGIECAEAEGCRGRPSDGPFGI
jgi:CRP/FNR family cyclic AMP-dependent transcriptional regulator